MIEETKTHHQGRTFWCVMHDHCL